MEINHSYVSFLSLFYFITSIADVLINAPPPPPNTHTRGEVIPGGNPTGMSYLFYYTEQNTKHKRGTNYKHQRFWIDTRRLPC